MVMSFNDLPAEILNEILIHVKSVNLRASQGALLRISKPWYAIADQKAVEHFRFADGFIRQTSNWSESYLRHVQANVRTLDATLRTYNQSNSTALKTYQSFTRIVHIISLCQNLQAFHLVDRVSTFGESDVTHLKSGIHSLGATLAALSFSTLTKLKIDFWVTAPADRPTFPPCMCELIVDILPRLQELHLRLDRLCVRFLHRALAKHGAKWSLRKLFINMSFVPNNRNRALREIRLGLVTKACECCPKRERNTSSMPSTRAWNKMLGNGIHSPLNQLQSLKTFRVLFFDYIHGEGLFSEDMFTGKRSRASDTDWTHIGCSLDHHQFDERLFHLY